MRKYCVILDQHELDALRETVIYTRSIAQFIGSDNRDGPLTVKLKNYAQMLEDVVSRIETMDMAK